MSDKQILPTEAEAAKVQFTAHLKANPSLIEGAATVTFLRDGNPKRPNTAAFARYARYGKDRGQTCSVSDYLKAGAQRIDLRWDFEHGYLTLTAAPSAEAKAKAS